MLPDICSFWHGPLGEIERLCLASFAAHGHRVFLYTYDPHPSLPKGVEWVDARTILPKEKMFRYKGNRTLAVFADLFRLKLMKQECGIWVDCDVLCLRPFLGLGEYVFGFETDGNWRNGFRPQVNNAVFRCPSDSALLKGLLEIFEVGAVPPGLPVWRWLEVEIRRALGDPLPVHYMQFGATGPMPLNALIQRFGLVDKVQPRSVFYPVSYEATRRLLNEDSGVDRLIKPETLAIHIWNSALTDRSGTGVLNAHPHSVIGKKLGELKAVGAI